MPKARQPETNKPQADGRIRDDGRARANTTRRRSWLPIPETLPLLACLITTLAACQDERQNREARQRSAETAQIELEDKEAEMEKKAICDSLLVYSQATDGNDVREKDSTISPTSRRYRDQSGAVTTERLSSRTGCVVIARNRTRRPAPDLLFWPESPAGLAARGWTITHTNEVVPGEGTAKTARRGRIRCRIQDHNPDEITVDDNGQEIPETPETKNMAFYQKTLCWVHDRPDR